MFVTVAKRSRTAQGVLAERAILTEIGVLSDEPARMMLTRPWAAFAWAVLHWPFAKRPYAVARAGLAARVLWYDGQVRAALDDGVDQIAVIGAGYDSRAWRFAREGASFYEVDHPTTQHDKIRRAPDGGPTYVQCDLSAQSAAEELRKHGLDLSRSVLFVLEGLSMYLSEEVVRRLLSQLASSSAPGSRLAMDFYPPRDAGTALDRRQMAYLRLGRAGSGESFRLVVTGPGAASFVEEAGWRVTELTDLRAAAKAAVPSDAGLPINSINKHKTLVAARRLRDRSLL